MSIKNILKSNNLFSYIVIHLVIVLVVILIMGGYLYRFFYNALYEDFMSGSRQYNMTIVNRHENDFQIMDDIVMQLGLAEDVTRFILSQQPEKSLKLKEHLKRYTTVSQSFDMILYQYHRDGYLYNHSTSINKDHFVQKWCNFDHVSKEQLSEILMSQDMELRIIPEQGVRSRWIDEYMGSNSKATFYVQTIAPEFEETVLFMIPESYYDNLLAGDYEKNKSFLFYKDDLIVSRGDKTISDDMLRHIWQEDDTVSALLKQEEIQREVSVGGNKYLLTVMQGDSGIFYGTLHSMELFTEKIRTEQWFIIILVFACIIPASFGILFFSGNMLKKFKKLSLLVTEDFSYDLNQIERGIQMLVDSGKVSKKENQELKKAGFIRDFIRKSWECREEVIEEAAKAGLYIDYEQYVVVLIRNKELSNEDKVYSLLLSSIIENKEVDGYGIHLVNNNQSMFVIYGDTQKDLEKVLSNMLIVEKEYGGDYIMAISNFHSDIKESSIAYLEADTAFTHHLLVSNSEIIRFYDVVKKEYSNFSLESFLKRLKHAIRNNDKNATEEVISDICEKIRHENVSLYAFRILYNDILQMLMSECKSNKLQLEHFYNVFTLSQCLNIQDFYELLSEACRMIIDSQEGKDVEKSDIVKKAILYIHQNYNDPELTMNALSEYLQVSSVTLSIEFKSEMEVKPSEYLANLRMEKSKELLRNTDMLVKDISVAVGYEDVVSFVRRFKKYAGMTPGQYREGV